MSAAKKIVNLIPLNTREEIVAEYKRLADEKSQLEAKARKLKKDADALKEKVVFFVKGEPDMHGKVGRFDVKANARSRENVSIADARQVLKGEALKAFNKLVTTSEWFELDVEVMDQVGEILDKMEQSKS